MKHFCRFTDFTWGLGNCDETLFVSICLHVAEESCMSGRSFTAKVIFLQENERNVKLMRAELVHVFAVSRE